MNYWRNLLIAANKLANAIMGGAPDETISAMVHRRGWRIPALLINAAFFDRNHCADTYASERAHAATEGVKG